MNQFKSNNQASENIFYEATVDGTINDKKVKITGTGTIINGITEGNYDLSAFPSAIDPQVLKIVLITGYPNACDCLQNSKNIFGNDSYTYKRNVKFSNGSYFDITVNCVREGNNLLSFFCINGNFENCEIANSEPIIECWAPTLEGKLAGQFRLSWKLNDSSYLYGDAKSEYSPKTSSVGYPVYHRYIKIDSIYNKETQQFYLLQNSKLFKNL